MKVCRQVTHSTQLRDTAWASNSCVLTFSSIGIWPEGADGTDVNACERSNGSKVMATGDDFGKVKLYSYPVKQPKVKTMITNVVYVPYNLLTLEKRNSLLIFTFIKFIYYCYKLL